MLAVAVAVVPIGIVLSLLGIPAVRRVITQHIDTLRAHLFGPPASQDNDATAPPETTAATPSASDDFDASVFTKVFTAPKPSINKNEAAP